MSPEQAEGHSKQVGPAADIYALGAILYQALTGRPPFLGESALETLKLVASTEVVAPRLLRPDVPRDLETICLKCLEKEPSKRYDQRRWPWPTTCAASSKAGRSRRGRWDRPGGSGAGADAIRSWPRLASGLVADFRYGNSDPPLALAPARGPNRPEPRPSGTRGEARNQMFYRHQRHLVDRSGSVANRGVAAVSRGAHRQRSPDLPRHPWATQRGPARQANPGRGIDGASEASGRKR